MNVLRVISKYIVPFVFLVFGITLIGMSLSEEKKERVMCYTGAVDSGKLELLTPDDLNYGNFPELNKRNNELGELFEKNNITKKIYSDTIQDLKTAVEEATIDSAMGVALRDSFIKEDVALVEQINEIITEKNTVNSQIQAEVKYQNQLLKKGIEIKPKTFSQPKGLLYGGLGVFVTAVLMFLFIANVISKQLTFILVPVFIVAAVVMIWMTFNSVDDLNQYDKGRQKAYAETKIRLLDIRTGVLQYKADNDKYPENLEELIRYIKEDTTYFIYSEGDPSGENFKADEAFKYYAPQLAKEALALDPDSTAYVEARDIWKDSTYIAWGDSIIGEEEALALGQIIRDTVKTSVREKLYTGASVVRKKSDFAFSADSLMKMAYYDVPFMYNSRVIEEPNKKDSTIKKLHRFEVRLSDPFYLYNNDDECEQRVDLILGSLYEEKTTGNWK